MNRFSYTCFYYLLLPGVFVRLLWRARRAPAYARRWGERLGFFRAPDTPGGLWVHAVSVGETVAAAPLIRDFQQQHPDLPVTVTTMTPTGSERVWALFGDSVFHVYVPYDTPGAVRRFLKRVQPRLLLVMETELWPNLIHQCARRQIPVMVANARLSARSAQGYARFVGLTQPMLQQLACVAAQNHEDGQRFIRLGLPAGRLEVTGSIKFDIEVPEAVLSQGHALRAQWGEARPVWIAASTHAGEDEQVLVAFREVLRQHPHTLLVLVPRHPERFAEVAELCRAQGFSAALRSKAEPVTATTQVLVGDTMGELMQLYSAADVAFVGGSLVPTGGHNFLEPAALKLPVIAGPHVFNFAQISELLRQAGGLCLVDNAAALGAQVNALLAQPDRRMAMGAAASSVVASNRGARQRLLALVNRQLS